MIVKSFCPNLLTFFLRKREIAKMVKTINSIKITKDKSNIIADNLNTPINIY